MTPEQRILQLEKKATKGPWRVEPQAQDASVCDVVSYGGEASFVFVIEDILNDADAEYIAALGTYGKRMAECVGHLRTIIKTLDMRIAADMPRDPEGGVTITLYEREPLVTDIRAALAALDAEGEQGC